MLVGLALAQLFFRRAVQKRQSSAAERNYGVGEQELLAGHADMAMLFGGGEP